MTPSSIASELRKVFLWAWLLPAFTPSSAQIVGPVLGQVGTTEARLLYRPGAVARDLRIDILNAQGAVAATASATSADAADYVAKFHATGLSPDTHYTYRLLDVTGGGYTLLAGGDGTCAFRTALPRGRAGVVTLAAVSCADATSEAVWERLAGMNLHGLLLGGDTPYVDTAALATVRQIHQTFLARPRLAALLRNTPMLSTWDDHDFGLNNGNGLTFAGGKPVTRQVFVEYRAHDQYGNGTGGVYCKNDMGAVEVFMLDPRWFSQTGPSPVDPAQKTCFGADQWAWLKQSLLASRAPFKVLLMGMIWVDKKNTETDDMHTYWYERDALFDFIRENRIPGVVLVGGDIHLSQHHVHRRRVGYDLHQFVTSPAHSSIIASLDVYNPDKEWSAIVPRQFLTLEADTRARPAVLTARYFRDTGERLHTVTVPYDELIPREGSGLGRGLRAWWSFDAGGENHAALGARVDVSAVNGAGMGSVAGVRGNAASFSRAAGQYLLAPRGVLPLNSARHTVSLWCAPSTLPPHGGTERHFLLETTPAGTATADNAGYGVSIGFISGVTPDKINLQLYTRTLQPAVSPTTAPTELGQGPFDTQVDRAGLTNAWTHVAMSFNSTNLVLYVNGQPAATHALPVPGPVVESGGLVMGGHRGGTGRNFDGRMDEVAFWDRVLSGAEILALHHGGTPEALPVAEAEADSDADTLPDWWEQTHGLNRTNATDAASDTDADGVPSFAEHLFGTSPLHDDRPFYTYFIERAAGAPAPGVAFHNPVDGTVGVEIALESSPDLVHWAPVDLASPGAGAQIVGNLLRLTAPPPASQRVYYRVRTGPAAE
jgi:alkaline phosphatase D